MEAVVDEENSNEDFEDAISTTAMEAMSEDSGKEDEKERTNTEQPQLDRHGLLDLSDRGLTKLSNQFRPEYAETISLNIAGNQIDRLDVGAFTALVELHASGNRIQHVSMFVPWAKRLRVLDLSNNEITCSSCERLNLMTALRQLNLSHNQIRTLPNLDRLGHLAELNLSSNRFSSLPDLHRLNALQTLLLHGNRIDHLNDAGSRLPVSVKVVDLGSNMIRDLTQITNLQSLTELERLNISGNPCVNNEDRKFEYRSYIASRLTEQLKFINDSELTETEILKGEWLNIEGKTRQFKPNSNAHTGLSDYLSRFCPLDPTDWNSGRSSMNSSLDEKKLQKVLQLKHTSQQRTLEEDNRVSSVSSNSMVMSPRFLTSSQSNCSPQKENWPPETNTGPSSGSSTVRTESSQTTFTQRSEAKASPKSLVNTRKEAENLLINQMASSRITIRSKSPPIPASVPPLTALKRSSPTKQRRINAAVGRFSPASGVAAYQVQAVRRSARRRLIEQPASRTRSARSLGAGNANDNRRIFRSTTTTASSSFESTTYPAALNRDSGSISSRLSKDLSKALNGVYVPRLALNSTPRAIADGRITARSLPMSAVSAGMRQFGIRQEESAIRIQAWWRGIRIRRRWNNRLLRQKLARLTSENMNLKKHMTKLSQQMDALNAQQMKNTNICEELTQVLQMISMKNEEESNVLNNRCRSLETMLAATLPVPSSLEFERIGPDDPEAVVVRWQNEYHLQTVGGYAIFVDGRPCGEVRALNRVAKVVDLDLDNEHRISLQAFSAHNSDIRSPICAPVIVPAVHFMPGTERADAGQRFGAVPMTSGDKEKKPEQSEDDGEQLESGNEEEHSSITNISS